MIFDCFTYSGQGVEDDLLKIRIEELRPLNPIHVIVESDETFTGIKKRLKFDADRFPGVKFRYITTTSHFADPWKNEENQRNAIMHALRDRDLNDDDIVIISDLDEIPRCSAIEQYRPEMGLAAIQMDMFHLYLNTRWKKGNWNMARIMTWSYLKDKEPDEIRRAGFPIVLYDAGWHFTYQGSDQDLLTKFVSFSHQEEAVQRYAEKAHLVFSRAYLLQPLTGDHLTVVSLEELPSCVKEFKHLLYEDVR